jgi:hypothetical protein
MAVTRAKTSSVAQGPSTSKSFLAGNPVILPGSYESIATVTVGAGGTTSVSFTSIPSTYKHLQIRVLSLASAGGSSATIEFNGTTAPNALYNTHTLYGNGSTVTASYTASYNFGPDFQGSASAPGATIIDILDYADTNKFKTTRVLGGYDANGSGIVGLTSNLWRNTVAISSIVIKYTTISQYSSFALYGIR